MSALYVQYNVLCLKASTARFSFLVSRVFLNTLEERCECDREACLCVGARLMRPGLTRPLRIREFFSYLEAVLTADETARLSDRYDERSVLPVRSALFERAARRRERPRGFSGFARCERAVGLPAGASPARVRGVMCVFHTSLRRAVGLSCAEFFNVVRTRCELSRSRPVTPITAHPRAIASVRRTLKRIKLRTPARLRLAVPMQQLTSYRARMKCRERTARGIRAAECGGRAL